MPFEAMKVGEVADRTGLTVRTLHHYDEIGLLSPSWRSSAGYRLYTAADLARLQQVVSLRQLGFSLEQIRDCLDRPGFSALEVIELHLTRLREQVAHGRALCARLETIAARLRAAGEVSAEEFLQSLQETVMIENYYTPEQRTLLEERRAQVGDERIRQASADWAELIAEVRAEKANGTDPLDPKVVALAKRWAALIHEFSGGDPGIERAVGRMWAEQGDSLVAQHGVQYDWRDVAEYIGAALRTLKG